MSSESGEDQLQPATGAACRTTNVVKITDDDGNLALSAEEIGLISSGLVTVHEFFTMPEEELDSLKLVYRTRLKWRKCVSPELV